MKHWMRILVGTMLLTAGCSAEEAPLGNSPFAPDRLRPGNVSQFLEVDDPRLRAQVARNLGNLGSRARPVVPELKKLLDDPDPDVRQAAQEALEKIRSQ